MSAESGTDKAVRREKIVMALGIAAIILFSANLLTMIARHFWPDYRFESLFGADHQRAQTDIDLQQRAIPGDEVHVFVRRHRQHDGEHKFVFQLNGENVHFEARKAFREKAANVEADLRAEMERLSRDIARQKRRLEADMNARHEVRLQNLRLDRVNELGRVRIQAGESAVQELRAERQIERSLGRLEAELEAELESVKNTLQSTVPESADSGN